MNTTFRLGALALAAVSLGACPSSLGSTSGTGGETAGATASLEGLVMLGPTCPVMRENDPTCADKPYQASFSLKDASGQETLRFASDAQGRFSVSARPGQYRLEPHTPSGAILPHAAPQDVTLTDGATTEVVVQYDTGIR